MLLPSSIVVCIPLFIRMSCVAPMIHIRSFILFQRKVLKSLCPLPLLMFIYRAAKNDSEAQPAPLSFLVADISTVSDRKRFFEPSFTNVLFCCVSFCVPKMCNVPTSDRLELARSLFAAPLSAVLNNGCCWLYPAFVALTGFGQHKRKSQARVLLPMSSPGKQKNRPVRSNKPVFAVFGMCCRLDPAHRVPHERAASRFFRLFLLWVSSGQEHFTSNQVDPIFLFPR